MIDLKKRLLPLLDENLPEDIAAKAIGKISPKLGQMLTKGAAQGLTLASGLNFLRQQFQQDEFRPSREGLTPEDEATERTINRSKELSQSGRNLAATGASALAATTAGPLVNSAISSLSNSIGLSKKDEKGLSKNTGTEGKGLSKKTEDPFEFISKYSDKLAQFIKNHLQKGIPPKGIAGLAKLPGDYDKIVSKIEKDTKENFADYLDRIFGSQSQGQSEQMELMGGQQAQPMQGNNSQGGPGQQQLMAILQKIQQSRGG